MLIKNYQRVKMCLYYKQSIISYNHLQNVNATVFRRIAFNILQKRRLEKENFSFFLQGTQQTARIGKD
jgi:hypothetical protein